MAPAYALPVLTTILLLLSTSTSTPPSTAAALQHPPSHHPSPGEYKVYFVLLKPRADGAHLAMNKDERREWHLSFLPSAFTVHGKKRMVSSYGAIFYGFAAWLTDDELDGVSRKPGFGRSFPAGVRHPATTRTPDFLGLNKAEAYVWANSNYGKGAIIGIMDTGANSEHPAFNDDGMPPPPGNWRGFCNTSLDFRCNNKIIGARSFVDDAYGCSDTEGHGTHVASIAAGNFVANASYSNNGQAAGTASGTAPAAHLAIYKVCDADGCSDTAILDAFDAAVTDGVDIISISIGPEDPPTTPDNYKNAIAIAAFRAVSRGVLVVACAGNDGPAPSTVADDAPWHFTVGAGSVDRRIVADMVLENGDILEGEALVQGVNSTRYYPLHCPGEDDLDCSYVSAQNASGHIVVCYDRDDEDPTIVDDLYDKGAEQVVLVSMESWGRTLQLQDYGQSTVQVSFSTGQKLRDYCKFPDAAAQVVFRGTLVDVAGAPRTAFFSSRGPSINNPSVIKPDILAPGLNILGAGIDKYKPYIFMSGTSMATPHVSGVAALLKNLHPDWSPAALRSALVTTANAYDNVGDVILDEQNQRATLFDIGGGHIRPQRAADPGVVYDMDATDYAAFLCNVLAGPHDDIQDLIGDMGLNCSTLPAGVQGFQLNYPTMVVPANTTVQRTLTNVGSGENYYPFVEMRDKSVKVHVSPEMLVFRNPGDRQSFEFSSEYQGKNAGVEGVLYWKSANYNITTYMVVYV